MKQSDRSQDLREYVNNHIRSNTILAVLGVTLEARVTGIPLHPKIQVQIDEVIDTLGIGGMVEGTSTASLEQMVADMRFNMLLDAKLFSRANDGLAWTHDETEQELAEKCLTRLSSQLAPRMKEGYDIAYFGNLKQMEYEIYLWKLSFADGGDEFVARMTVNRDKVAGILIN
jgi:hypothetical protein